MGMIKNSGVIIVGMIIGNALAFVFHLYAGRVLGLADYGVFGALMALFSIIALPANAISSAITKFAARFYSRGEYSKIGKLRKEVSKRVWIYSIILFLIITSVSWFIASFLKINSVIPIIVVGFTLIFTMILPVNRGILQGMKKFKIYSINTVIEAVSRVLLLFILLFIGLGVNGAVLAYGLGYLIAYLFVFPYIKEIKHNKEDKVEMKPIYKYIVIVLIVNFLFNLIINLPIILIKHFLSSEFTGNFTAALTIAKVTLLIAGGVALVMFPEVAGLEDKKEKRKIFSKALILTLLASTAMAIIVMIFSKLAMTLLYGKDFLGAAPILVWLELAMIPLSVLQLWMNYWLAGRELKGRIRKN